MNLTVDVQVASDGDDNPDPESIRTWLWSILDGRVETSRDIEVSVRIVDAAESQALNAYYRKKDSATNVLSFPSESSGTSPLNNCPINHLGDIVICDAVVRREAQEQDKDLRAHWAHMIVHGALHLLGYDHIDDDDATEMENLETQIMADLAFPPLYQYSHAQ